MSNLNSNAEVNREIALAIWTDCDTYSGCPTCGPRDDGAPELILKRGRIHTFEIGLDGRLVPICFDCAKKHAPELTALIAGGCVLCDKPHEAGGMFWTDDRWICSECWTGVADAYEQAEIAALRMKIVIKDNNCATNDPCAICGARTDKSIGPELFLEGTWRLVCHHNCGKTVPGLLEKLKKMQEEFDEQWRQMPADQDWPTSRADPT